MSEAETATSPPEIFSPEDHIRELNSLVTKTPYSRTRIFEIAKHYAAGHDNAIEHNDLATALVKAAEMHGIGEEPLVVAARRKIALGPINW